MAAISDDDDIVAGPQKMSLKCPVRQFDFDAFRTLSNGMDPAVELHAHQYALSVCAVCAFAMFRCNIMVLSDGADNDIYVPCLREGSEPRGSHH